jgi:hypothetical protein
MIGVILNLALRDNSVPPAELHYTHLVNAHTSALTALAQARRDPQTPPRTIAALERMVADYEGILRKLQSKRPEFSIGMVTQLTTWGTTDWTF